MTKRLLMPLMILGIMLSLGNMAFAASAVTCGLSTLVGTNLGPTANSPVNGHTEPIGAGLGGPTTPGGGTLRVTCTNPATGTGSGPNDPGVVILTVQLSAPITNSSVHPTTTTGI